MKREELEAALGVTVYDLGDVPTSEWNVITAAARERLAQLPEKCEHPKHGGLALACYFDPVAVLKHQHLAPCYCPDCGGKGVLYPPALVERIAAVLHEQHDDWAVAVLDALNETR